jgi:hypothetical protein
MSKRMREYVVHWLLLHGTDWVNYNEVDDVFTANYHLPINTATQAIESVLHVMMKAGYLSVNESQYMIPTRFKLAKKSIELLNH